MFSIFARGKLQQKLMETLNKKGYDFMEVEGAFTSQLCPKCGNLDSDSRNYKVFECTCCGYSDDADYVASVNIMRRATDKEVLDLCNAYGYQKGRMLGKLRQLYFGRFANN